MWGMFNSKEFVAFELKELVSILQYSIHRLHLRLRLLTYIRRLFCSVLVTFPRLLCSMCVDCLGCEVLAAMALLRPLPPHTAACARNKAAKILR